MTTNTDLILAGIAGQTGTPSLAWFGPAGSTLPTDATTALDAALKDLGLVSSEGLSINTATDTTEVDAYGLFAPARIITTKETKTFKVTGIETNVVSLSLAKRLPLTGSGSLTVDTTDGSIDVTEGPARSVKYVAVFDMVDGLNKVRKVLPSVELTGTDDESIAKAANVAYGMTFTAYPDSSGISVYSYYILDALKV